MPRINSKKVDAEIGRRIRQLRTHRGISSEALGKKLGGVTFQAVCKFERGSARITVATMLAMSKALGVSTDYFLRGL